MKPNQQQARRFAGYAAIFDHPDRGGDIVRKGAFARAAKAGLPLLWQHDQGRRIGFVERVEEDARGLRVIAQMDPSAPPVAALPRDLPGWRIESCVFLRSFVARNPAGAWAGVVDYRIRMLSGA
jgi:HK97 family phage prohead protease